MDIRKLQRVIVDALEDVKATDIKVFNSTGLTQLFDRVIIASGTSNRQTRALAASVRDKVKAAGGTIVSIEGEDTGEWVLVDVGDAVVHVMQPAIRQYYNLEEIWGAKPVAMKALDDADRNIPRAARAADPARKAVAKKSLASKKSAPRPAARKTQAPH
jgi:ribosome-associated protein